MSKFNIVLKKLRLNKKLKQSEMAELLGITVTQYSRYECAQSFPRFNELMMLADFFECSLDFLCGREKHATFQTRLKELRLSKNLSQKQLGELTQIGTTTVQSYELGTRVPSINIAIALSDYFNVTLDYLVGREG